MAGLRLPIHLQETAKILAIDETVSVLRHEVRNKLTSIRNAAFYLRKKGVGGGAGTGEDPKIRQFLELIDTEAAAAEQTLASRAPRAQEGERQRLDLGAIARTLVAGLERPAEVRLRVNAGGPVWCAGDPVQLELALFFLIDNAVEALAGGGTVTVTVGDDALEVEDDGPGLGAAAERAFEPFFSTRPGRLGLGLNVARTIAARHGGTVEIGAGPGGRGVRAVIRVAGGGKAPR